MEAQLDWRTVPGRGESPEGEVLETGNLRITVARSGEGRTEVRYARRTTRGFQEVRVTRFDEAPPAVKLALERQILALAGRRAGQGDRSPSPGRTESGLGGKNPSPGRTQGGPGGKTT